MIGENIEIENMEFNLMLKINQLIRTRMMVEQREDYLKEIERETETHDTKKLDASILCLAIRLN